MRLNHLGVVACLAGFGLILEGSAQKVDEQGAVAKEELVVEEAVGGALKPEPKLAVTPAVEAAVPGDAATGPESAPAETQRTPDDYPRADEIRDLDPAAVEQPPSDDQLRLF